MRITFRLRPAFGLVGLAVASLALFGCFGDRAQAGQGDREGAESDSEKPYAFRSYEKKVAALREIPDEPELTVDGAPPADSSVERSEEEWRQTLTAEEYRILRENGTERAGSGELTDNLETGVYECAACGAPLFSSRDKFHSGTGWPSFTSPYQKGRVGYSKDGGLFSYRVEVHCARCGGHLGHVFNDGPEPTGKRYCINSVALDFRELETNGE